MVSPNNNQPTDHEDGLSVLDLANLPLDQYVVMRVMLRQVELSYTALCRTVESLPEKDRLTRAQLDDVLQALTAQQWLSQTADGYRANLRRKSGRVLSEFVPPRRKNTTLRTIWDSLEADDAGDHKQG